MQSSSELTKIDLVALKGGDLQRLSIARRMLWAANRQTTVQRIWRTFYLVTYNGDQYARIYMPQLLQMCSLNSQNRFEFQGFNPTKPQDQLMEIRSSKSIVARRYSKVFSIPT